MINEVGMYSQQSASALLKTGSGKILGFMVSSGTPTVKLWDNTAASGAVILNTLQTAAATWYEVPVAYATGCYATITGTAEITFVIG